MKHEIKIEGMNCGHCVEAVKRELAKLPGLSGMDVEIGAAMVETEGNSVSRDELIAAIEAAGFAPHS